MAVEISGQAYAFKDESCTSTKTYICVTQDTTLSSTGGRNAQRECAVNYGLNESQLKKKLQIFKNKIIKLQIDDLASLMTAFHLGGAQHPRNSRF